MPSAANIFSHTLDALKGWGPYMTDKVAPLDPNLDVTTVFAGMVLSLNASGNLVLGLPAATTGTLPMPLFLRQNADDNDVNPFTVGTPVTSAGISGQRFGVAGPILGCLVATGGYELDSTEFVSATYAPGTLLTAKDANGPNPGKLVAATLSARTTPVCGISSEGVKTNHNGSQVLRFWTCVFS